MDTLNDILANFTNQYDLNELVLAIKEDVTLKLSINLSAS